MNFRISFLLSICCALLKTSAASTSCTADRCSQGYDSSQPCQCNSQCMNYQNCCADYSNCNPAYTCENRVCSGHDNSLPCQCNESCVKYGDCCPDYEQVCLPASTEDSCVGRCVDSGIDTSKSCQCNSACSQYNDCCSDYNEVCTGSTGTGTGTGTGSCAKLSVSNQELIDSSAELWAYDVNSAQSGQVQIDIQGATTTSATNDVAPQPFFTYVDQELLNRDMFVKLQNLQDNYFKYQGETEVVTSQEVDEENEFLDAFLATEVGIRLYNFLDSKNRAGCNGVEGFKAILQDIWFGMFDRLAPDDTSGFEHSFVGEIKGSKVSGFHNWVSFYHQELDGTFNYQGYLSDLTSPRTVGMRHTWYGATKPINGFTIGTSPEIEMALYTLCYLTRPGQVCHISNQDGTDTISIQTYEWTNSAPGPSGLNYIASAYFIS